MSNDPTKYVIGCDISKYDVEFNDYTNKITKIWNPDNIVAPAHIDFVIQRCSYGKTQDQFVNELYEQTLKVSIRGAYHYFTSGIGWKVQLDTILAACKDKKYHFFVIDYETIYNTLNATSFAEMMELVKQLKLATKKNVVLYFNADVYQNYMKPYNADAIVNDYDVWFAMYPWKLFVNFDKLPSLLPNNIKNCRLWQYGGDASKSIFGYGEGSKYGSPASSIDLSVWYGTLEEMKIWANVDDTHIITPPPITNPSRYTGNVLGTVSDGLKIRNSAITGDKIGLLNHDDYFEADILDENKWFHLTFPIQGYVSSIYTKYIDNDKITTPNPTIKNLGLYYVIPHFRPNTSGPALSPCSRNTKLFDNASQLPYDTWSKYLLEINKYDNSGKEKTRLIWIDDPLGGPTKGINENNKYRWIGLAYPGNVVLLEDIVDGDNGVKWAKIKCVQNNIVPDSTKINYVKTPHLVHQCFGWNPKNELFPLIGNKGGCVVPVVGESNWYIPMSELQTIHVTQNMNIRDNPSTSATIVGSKIKGSEVYFTELSERDNINDDLWGKINEGWVAIKVGKTRYTDWKFI